MKVNLKTYKRFIEYVSHLGSKDSHSNICLYLGDHNKTFVYCLSKVKTFWNELKKAKEFTRKQPHSQSRASIFFHPHNWIYHTLRCVSLLMPAPVGTRWCTINSLKRQSPNKRKSFRSIELKRSFSLHVSLLILCRVLAPSVFLIMTFSLMTSQR